MKYTFKLLLSCIIAATLTCPTHNTSVERASTQTLHHHRATSSIDTKGIYIDVAAIAQYAPLSCGATAFFIVAATNLYRGYQKYLLESLVSAAASSLLGLSCLALIDIIKKQQEPA